MRIIYIYLLFISNYTYSAQVSTIDSLRGLLKQKDISKNVEIRVLNELSNNYYKTENYVAAIQTKNEELSIYNKQENDSMVAICNERLGMMHYHIGSYISSSQHFIKALSYFESKNNLLMVAQITGNLANVYTRLDNHKQSLNYLYQSKSILSKKEFYNKKSIASLYTNIGLAYAEIKELDSAMLFYEEALSLVSESESPLYVASILNNIGEVDFELKNYKKALKNYKKSSVIFQQINHINGRGTAELNVAKVKIQLEEFKEAITLCEKALLVFKKTNSLYFIADAEKHLSIAYKGLGDNENALKHLELYIAYNEKLKGAQTLQHITNMEMQYLSQKEEQKLALQEQKSQLIEKELKLKQARLYFLIGSILVLLAITTLTIIILKGSLQRNKLKQKVLEQEQESLKKDLFFKQKGIENFATHIQEKNNLLSDLKNEIKTITKKLGDDKTDGLKKLIQIVNQSLHTDNDRKELELKIDQTHQEFINRLKGKFPKLTKTEVRLCSLLLLDFSTKEIASIMNIEPASVKMGRNRLRKKINLKPGANIVDFLRNI